MLIANDFNLLPAQIALEYLQIGIEDFRNAGEYERIRLQITWPSGETNVAHPKQPDLEFPILWIHSLCQVLNIVFQRQIVAINSAGADRAVVKDGEDVSNVPNPQCS